MFGPKTVAQAIAPFKKVITNLNAVAEAQDEAIRVKSNEVARVLREAELFAEGERKHIEVARAERAAATRLMEKLSTLFDSDDDDTTVEEDTAAVQGATD